MKRSLILTLLLSFGAITAWAQFGAIIPASDLTSWAWDCNIYDPEPGLVTIYVLHVLSPQPMSGSQFKIDHYDDVVLTWLADTVTPPYQSIGNSQTGIAVSYGSCQTSTIHIMTITYIGNGLSEACSLIWIAPSPASVLPNVVAFDCSDPPRLVAVNAGGLVVNPDATCYCGLDPDPVEQTSWGSIKALYLDSE